MERLGVSGFLVLLFVVTHAAVHDTPSGSRLEQKDSNVLQIECRIPYYTAWTERWDTPAPVDLQVSFKGTGAYDSLEVVANMTSSATTPKTYGRFKDVDSMVRAEGRKIAEADEKCENCRSLVVLLPMTPTISLYGTYYCYAMYIKGHIAKKEEYQVQVDEKSVVQSETKTNGTLTVKRVKAAPESNWDKSKLGKEIGLVATLGIPLLGNFVFFCITMRLFITFKKRYRQYRAIDSTRANQGEVGANQGVVGAGQGGVGAHQGGVSANQGEVGANQGGVGAGQEAVGANQVGVGAGQEVVGASQGENQSSSTRNAMPAVLLPRKGNEICDVNLHNQNERLLQN